MFTRRSASSAFVIAAAIGILLSGCGARTMAGVASGPETSSSAATTSSPTSVAPTTQDVTRVSYVTICPDLIDHGSASADLVTEFVNGAQALADKGAATTARFDSLIEDLEYDIAAAPVELVPYLEEQVDTMIDLRDYLQVGGNRNTEFREYKSASMEIVNQCMPYI